MVGSHSLVRLRLMSGMLLLAVLASAAAAAEPKGELERAVEQLASDTFLEREKASQLLLDAGGKAIGVLEASLEQAELETMTRVLHLLEVMALESEDSATREAAVACLTRLAGSRRAAISERSSTVLSAVRREQRAAALAQLERLGAKLNERQMLVGPGFVAAGYTLEIGVAWRGTLDDLKLLSRIDDVPVLILVGEKVDNAWLEHVAALASLQSLTLKKTSVTAAGIERLKELKELQVLDVLYSPLEDDALASIKEMPQLSLVRLFGTKVTKEAAAKLAADKPGTKIDLRRGGFCGIGVQAHPLGCIVSNVQARSAAERAGLELGDLLLSFDGKNPKNFEELTEVIAQHKPGDEVAVERYRNGERETLKITLGEWE